MEDFLGWHAIPLAEWLWYQRHQLLLPDSFSVYRNRGHNHILPNHWTLRCGKDLPHFRLAPLPYRSTRATKPTNARRRGRLDLHVDYCKSSLVHSMYPILIIS